MGKNEAQDYCHESNSVLRGKTEHGGGSTIDKGTF